MTLKAVSQEFETEYFPQNEVAFGATVFHTQFANRNFLGIALEGHIYLKNNWSAGFNVAVTSKNVANDFNYYVEKPTVSYAEFSFVNRFDVYKTNKFRVAFSLSNGVAVATLSDRAFSETTDDLIETPLTIASNYFYVLQAGAEAAVRIRQYRSGYDLYIKTEVKNRKTFGSANFGTSTDFKGLYFGLGVIIHSKF